MKIKTSELTGAALDWAVAKCERAGVTGIDNEGDIRIAGNGKYTPSTNWSQGGPIIEREGLSLTPWYREKHLVEWTAKKTGSAYIESGPTPLIAAMRCRVASKLGDEVEIPEELK